MVRKDSPAMKHNRPRRVPLQSPNPLPEVQERKTVLWLRLVFPFKKLHVTNFSRLVVFLRAQSRKSFRILNHSES